MIQVSEPYIGEKEKEHVDDAVSSGWVNSHGKCRWIWKLVF